MAKIDEFLAKILSSRYGKDVRQSIHDSIEEINNVNEANISTVQTIANTAQGYANNASASATSAQQSVTDAQTQVTLAQQQVPLATAQAENASDSAEDSEAWAVGKRGGVDVPSTDDTYQNNAKYWQERANYWYQQAQIIAESFSGALRPMGTVAFADLPSIASSKAGDMYNISDPFTTTSDFVEGAGLNIPMGANVYKVTINNVPKWDILAGSSAQVYTGTEAQIEQAIQQGLLGEGVMINSLDDGDDDLLTTSMISHDGDSLENKLDDIDDSISQLNSDLSALSLEIYKYQNAEINNSRCTINVQSKPYERVGVAFPNYVSNNGFKYAYGIPLVAVNSTQGTVAVRNYDGATVNGQTTDFWVILWKA